MMKPIFHFSRFAFPFLLFTSAVIALSSLLNAHQAQAHSGIQLENVGATVQFGEQITFVATIKASIPIQNVSIVILDEAQGTRNIEPLDMQPDGTIEFHFDTKQNVLRPFTNVKWNYQFTLSDGSTMQSESFSVHY